MRVGVGFVAALLFNAGLDHAALTALVVDEGLDNIRLFKVLILSELDREPGADSRSGFFQEELFIKAVASLATQDHLNAIFDTRNLCVEVGALVVDHEPTLMAHISLPQFFIFIDRFLFTLVPCLVT